MKPYLLFILVIFYSCHREKPHIEKTRSQIGRKTKPKTWVQELTQAEKDHQIYGAFEISKGKIVLLRRSIGFELSTDNGKTWTWLGKNITGINEFTVDDKGVCWALERWKGIHGPSYCRLYKSTDFGITWQTCEFNPMVFFPYHIYSKPDSTLEVTNFGDNKVYKLLGKDPSHSWKYIKQLPKVEDFADISAENYFISGHRNDDNVLYVKRINAKTDTLFHFKKAYNIYQIEKVKNVIYVAGPMEDDSTSYFATIVNDRNLKEYTIPGVDLNINTTRFNHVFLLSSTGAYLFKDNKLIHIFK